MYAGQIMETAAIDPLFASPLHPYTRALMASLPALHGEGETLATIPGLPPDLIQPVPGCPFAPRCTHSADVCNEPIALEELSTGHATACTRVRNGELKDLSSTATVTP
jgi:oligopeptide/dipeptide ABC transporter ATP-binding protein